MTSLAQPHWHKIANFPHPVSFSALAGDDPFEFMDPETRVRSIRVTDRQTERRTELRWLRCATAVAAVARKKVKNIQFLIYHFLKITPS